MPRTPPRYVYKYYPPTGVVALRNKTLRFTQPTHLNDPFEMKFAPLVATDGGRLKILNSPTDLYRILDREFGVLSLTAVPNSLLMWAHYAASHTGFLIAFDSQHPSFKSLGPTKRSGALYPIYRGVVGFQKRVTLSRSISLASRLCVWALHARKVRAEQLSRH